MRYLPTLPAPGQVSAPKQRWGGKSLGVLLPILLCFLMFVGCQAPLAEKNQTGGGVASSVSSSPSLEGEQNGPTKIYQKALPGYRFQFPKDHASHPAFKTEWWYYTGHLKSDTGKRYGYELTFFRVGSGIPEALLPQQTRWALNDLILTHFALTQVQDKQFTFQETFNRAVSTSTPVTQPLKPFDKLVAGSLKDHYTVWNGPHHITRLDNGDHQLTAVDAEHNLTLNLRLSAEKPPVIHGAEGVSQKADCRGCASHYYSLTRLKTDGELVVSGKAHPVQGQSWMDHEFGSNQLTPQQVGWDWFSIQLNTPQPAELMLYGMRQQDGRLDPHSSGTWVTAHPSQGQQGAKDKKGPHVTPSEHLALKAFNIQPIGQWTSPKTGAVYPSGWTVTVPEKALSLTVNPFIPNQELVTTVGAGTTYWEGACSVIGTWQGRPVTGEAYVELTGYAQRFSQSL